MIVVLAFVELVDCLTAFKIAADQDARLLELGQHAIDRGQADIRAFFQQHPKDIFRCHVALCAFLKDLQDLQAWQRCFEPGAFEFVDVRHGRSLRCRGTEACRYNGLIIASAPSTMLVKARSRAHSGVFALVTFAAVALSACSSVDGVSKRIANVVTPYKVTVVQGNFVSREQVDALQAGMSRQQVREILGTPLVTSLFHADRWDYVFTLKRADDSVQTRRLTVYFQGDTFVRSDGDAMLSESEFVASLGEPRAVTKVPVLEATPEQLARFPAPSKSPATSATPAPSPASGKAYPPLEPGAR